MKPIRIEGNLIVVDKALWRDAEGKARRKAAKQLLCGPGDRSVPRASASAPPDPA
jgi:hypothetical protein